MTLFRQVLAACLLLLTVSAAHAQSPARVAPASPSASPATPATPSATPPTATATPGQPAAGGTATAAGHTTPNPGDVWVNTSTKKYHCAGSRSYGKTKRGAYMTEAAAKAAGAAPAGGKVCTKS